MVYVDESYYYGTYKGTVDEASFPRLAVHASAYLDYCTHNRAEAKADLAAVKMCCCALIDQYQVIEAAQELAKMRVKGALEADTDVKSETVGSYSRTLSPGGESAAMALSVVEDAQKRLYAICSEHLAYTGLLYRGGCQGCTLPTL